MNRLIEKIVFCGLVTAWRFAAWPTRRSPLLVNATTEGVVRAPSLFSNTTGSPPSMTAMHELVVPRSIPKTLAILYRNPFWSEFDLRHALARGIPDVSYDLTSLLVSIYVYPRWTNRDGVS